MFPASSTYVDSPLCSRSIVVGWYHEDTLASKEESAGEEMSNS